ncbi:thioredoxin-like protein [Dactylonectria macrodidyma]|uniref:Thioredoxin-like protein n=1 Tax=Dactylonectria macrodidyma TaxID=307937 RepID=A0A9P9DTL5_9HYPO|nr:thioredoxin-like protein [Dactylonectria macrodidyma]
MRDFHIVLTLDVGCPWCYLGWKRLQNAISFIQKNTPDNLLTRIRVTYRTMSINPALPKSGIDRGEYLLNKMSSDVMSNVHSKLRALGEAEGIRYSLEGKIGNTKDVHRLLYLRKKKSAETEERLLSIIFRTHFEEDGDITSHKTLISCGRETGLDKIEVKDWLDSNGGVTKEGIVSVPHFVINGCYKLEGTPDSQVLTQILTSN